MRRGPGVQLRSWFAEAPPGQLAYLAMISVAYADAYDAPIETWLAPDALRHQGVIAEGCLLDVRRPWEARAPALRWLLGASTNIEMECDNS